MTESELIQGAKSRYDLYELDARARSGIKAIWPVIAPHLGRAVDAILDAAAPCRTYPPPSRKTAIC